MNSTNSKTIVSRELTHGQAAPTTAFCLYVYIYICMNHIVYLHMYDLYECHEVEGNCVSRTHTRTDSTYDSVLPFELGMLWSCHIWMSHVTLMNESCHTYEWVLSHMNESCHTYEWVLSHMNESCHTWMSHVTYMNGCVTYEWVVSHVWMSHVAYMNGSCQTYTYIYVYIYISLYMYTYIYTCMNTCRYIYVCIYVS